MFVLFCFLFCSLLCVCSFVLFAHDTYTRTHTTCSHFLNYTNLCRLLQGRAVTLLDLSENALTESGSLHAHTNMHTHALAHTLTLYILSQIVARPCGDAARS
jgi:hypothetical protein